MNVNSLSEMCKAIAPALGNHLWQSTLFAIAAGLLTLLLRNNHAPARYVLWLTASVKFLIPFSLLVAVGGHLPWLRSSAGAKSGVYFAFEEVSQPFSQPAMSAISHAAPLAAESSLIRLLPALLAAVWLGGFVVVVLMWCLRWRRMTVALRGALPVKYGRELDALHRLERNEGVAAPIELVFSKYGLEPGILGIYHPVLLLPAGMSECLTDAQLEAIITHELCHVRRHDNLAAAVHMFVEAIFWFHPLVWWIGTRLVEERERACDEEVLRMGSDSQVYAESILKVCEFYLESPLLCAAGVTGSNLKKRIEAIMTHRNACDLELGKKLLLATFGAMVFIGPVVFGLLNATQSRAQSPASITASAPVFEVASIRANESGDDKSGISYPPSGFAATNVTLQMLMRAAYGVEDNRISGAPSWLNAESYDVDAKVDSSRADELRKLGGDKLNFARQRMLQALLADRFKLTVHREAKVLPVYALIMAEDGPKLQQAKPGDTYAEGFKGIDGLPAGPHQMILRGSGEFKAQAQPVAALARVLSRVLGCPVLDKAGLTGNYDFTLKWTPDESLAPMFRRASSPGSSGPSIFAALQEQLGLKLVTQQAPVEILVIDHAEKPAEN